jgi:DNA-directed RNA polymerase specialized sigma24 family protein
VNTAKYTGWTDPGPRLDTVINLLALNAVSDLSSLREKAVVLRRAGLAPKHIAALLGTTANAVSVSLSTRRRAVRRTTPATAKEENHVEIIEIGGRSNS